MSLAFDQSILMSIVVLNSWLYFGGIEIYFILVFLFNNSNHLGGDLIRVHILGLGQARVVTASNLFLFGIVNKGSFLLSIYEILKVDPF